MNVFSQIEHRSEQGKLLRAGVEFNELQLCVRDRSMMVVCIADDSHSGDKFNLGIVWIRSECERERSR